MSGRGSGGRSGEVCRGGDEASGRAGPPLCGAGGGHRRRWGQVGGSLLLSVAPGWGVPSRVSRPGAGHAPAVRGRRPGGARLRSAARSGAWPGGLPCRRAGTGGRCVVPLSVRLVMAWPCGSGLSPHLRARRSVGLSRGVTRAPAHKPLWCVSAMDKMTSCLGLGKPTPC